MASSGPRKMKAYPSFDAFQADQMLAHRNILRALRAFVRETEPSLEEAVKWGNGCWVGPRGPVAYAHCSTDHVQFGFFSGALLDDPTDVLERFW